MMNLISKIFGKREATLVENRMNSYNQWWNSCSSENINKVVERPVYTPKSAKMEYKNIREKEKVDRLEDALEMDIDIPPLPLTQAAQMANGYMVIIDSYSEGQGNNLNFHRDMILQSYGIILNKNAIGHRINI